MSFIQYNIDNILDTIVYIIYKIYDIIFFGIENSPIQQLRDNDAIQEFSLFKLIS